jgi:hypothetical protein
MITLKPGEYFCTFFARFRYHFLLKVIIDKNGRFCKNRFFKKIIVTNFSIFQKLPYHKNFYGHKTFFSQTIFGK